VLSSLGGCFIQRYCPAHLSALDPPGFVVSVPLLFSLLLFCLLSFPRKPLVVVPVLSGFPSFHELALLSSVSRNIFTALVSLLFSLLFFFLSHPVHQGLSTTQVQAATCHTNERQNLAHRAAQQQTDSPMHASLPPLEYFRCTLH
jgi:hypothetical protein